MSYCTSRWNCRDAQVPTIDGYHAWGENKGIKTESLSQQFTPDKEPDMDYYRYMGEKRDDKVSS